jgi:hypothetical protein
LLRIKIPATMAPAAMKNGKCIAAFAARLQDATDLDMVRTDLAATVHQALEPAHLTLWSGRVER